MPFTFYYTLDADSIRSYIPAVPVMLPASSWARIKFRRPNLPAGITERAADCGGFVATMRWGDYRYTPAEYVSWLETWGPTWAATMDYCCEDEITSGKAGVVRDRQQRTTDMAYRFWSNYRAAPWAWVPTVQGWQTDDYRRHAAELRPLVQEMAAHYQGGAFRVGIGTLCRRASTRQVREVVKAVSEELPGIPLHLWGVKLGAIGDRVALPESVQSVDSAAWKGLIGYREREWKASGLSQRRWIFEQCLPEYARKVAAALAAPKQLELFCQGAI